MSEITGVRKRAPTVEVCPSCRLHGRTSWLMVETLLIGGAIEAQLCCTVPTCGLVIRRPSTRVAETTHPASTVAKSFRTLRQRIFTPRITAMAGLTMAFFYYIVFA